MRKISLRLKFAVLFIVVTATVLAGSAAWSAMSQQEQAEKEMLEKAQILTQEMDAVWAFFETNQHQFKEDENGNYELYCVIAAKSVSKFFTSETDYSIHYTNSTTRRLSDAPDEFETKGMDTFLENPELVEYYAIEDMGEGSQVFRYMQPLYMTASCLECHGDPVGELDSFGYEKEGKKEGDIAGAISIVMPIDIYMKGIRDNTFTNILFFGAMLLIGFAAIYYGVSKLVTNPICELEGAAKQIESGNLDINVDHIGNKDEIHDLAERISLMAKQLKLSYENLENQVRVRTDELAHANEILRDQRVELENANEILKESNEFKSDFLAIMSHELRAPLTSILAFAEIWEKSNKSTDEKERAAVHEIRENGQLLLHMVDNILETAKAEAGKIELIVEPVDMVDLLGSLEKSMAFLAEKREISLKTQVDSDVPIIIADWEKLRRILENLTSNAIKYTKRGGEVRIEVSTDNEKDGIVINVIDNGIGITEENLPYVFEKYTQIDKSSQKRYSGSGLGLAVVKELIELHNGTVSVQSSYKSGSTFSVFIPFGDNIWEEKQ